MGKESYIANQIKQEIDRRHSKMGSMNMRKKNIKTDELRNCICLICNEKLDLLTHVHAAKHGYECKEDMVADSKVKWL